MLIAAFRRMLKTQVTQGNISPFLLKLIKRLIFAMFKDSSPYTNVHAININILVHEVRLLLALTFVLFPYLLGSCRDMYFRL